MNLQSIFYKKLHYDNPTHGFGMIAVILMDSENATIFYYPNEDRYQVETLVPRMKIDTSSFNESLKVYGEL